MGVLRHVERIKNENLHESGELREGDLDRFS